MFFVLLQQNIEHIYDDSEYVFYTDTDKYDLSNIDTYKYIEQ